MAATMIADGGELTIVRPLAAWVWGVWEVTHDDDAAPEDLIDERKLGFVGALDHPPAGRFGRRFIREDVSVDAVEKTSTVEEVLDAAAARTQGREFFERDITAAGLGRLVPGVHFDVNDRVDVRLWGRVLAGQLVTEIDRDRAHIGGQVLSDRMAREAANREMDRKVMRDRRELADNAREAKRTARAASRRAEDAKTTADTALAEVRDADGTILSHVELARKAQEAASAASEESHGYSEASQEFSKQARVHTDAASGHSDRARKHSEASLGHAEDAQREAQKALLASAESSQASQASVVASRASGAASASSVAFSAIAHDWSEESHKWSAESQEFSQQARVHTDAASGHSDRARKHSEASLGHAEDAQREAQKALLASAESSQASQASVVASEESGKASKASQKASREATASKQVSVDAMQKAERYRNEAESARDDAERKRAEAEAKRDEAETFRRGSFASMSASHAAMSIAEMQRMEAEDERKKAENARGEAEDRRKAAERFRDQAERKRDEAERHRQAAAEARDETLSIHQWSSNQQMDVHSNMVWWTREQRTRVYSHDASHGRKTHEGGLLTTWDYQAKRGLSFSAQGNWWGKVAFTVEYKAVTGGGSAVDLWTFNVGPGHRSDNFERGAIGMQFSHAHIVVEVWKPNNAVWYIPVDTATGKIADVSMYDTPAGNPFAITSTGALEVRGIGARLDNIIRPDPKKNIFTPAQVTIPGTKRRVWPAYIKVTET